MLVRVFIHPSVSEGSLGTCVPRENKKGSVLRDDTDGLSPRAPLLCHSEVQGEGSPMKRHPEQSEGSLGTGVPRENKKGSVLRDDTDGLSPRAPLLCHSER